MYIYINVLKIYLLFIVCLLFCIISTKSTSSVLLTAILTLSSLCRVVSTSSVLLTVFLTLSSLCRVVLPSSVADEPTYSSLLLH